MLAGLLFLGFFVLALVGVPLMYSLLVATVGAIVVGSLGHRLGIHEAIAGGARLVKGGLRAEAAILRTRAGLGIDDLDDDLLMRHLQPGVTGIWQPTDRWDNEHSWDRTWS